MRLRHIKIAGFKSFADPITVNLEKPFTGIVGPNGCGKSNIIDAVRWVLGEARLSELRGSSSMKELIFAGSSGRKPLGRASVELLLSNEDARIKGPWGEYAEITVKRVVNADGQSQYFINQQQVRRRDVLDIFMGTGLGPKSYAIISQGMISSFIKAKPEELRVYLEEAAGVLLYRERRRETEQLIVQTQSNLERVQDALSIKLDEHARLKVEADLVDRWTALTEEKRQAEALWYFVQYEDVRKQLDALGLKRAKAETQLQEARRQADLAERALQTIQGELSPLESVVQKEAALLRQAEKDLTLQESEERQREERLRKIEADIKASEEEFNRKTARLESLRTHQEESNSVLTKALEEEEFLEEEIDGREENVDRAQSRAEEEAAKLSEKQAAFQKQTRALDMAKNQLDSAERAAQALAQRIERLEENAKRITPPDAAEREAAKEKEAEAQEILEDLIERADDLAQAQREARESSDAASEAYFTGLAYQKQCLTQYETLEEQSHQAEGETKLSAFEEEQGLEGLRRLHEVLSVKDEWVKAVDAILGHRTNSILLRMIGSVLFQEHRPPAPLSFIETGSREAEPIAMPNSLTGTDFPSLRSQLTTTDAAVSRALDEWLMGLWCAPTVRAAFDARANLGPGERLITPDGDVISRVGIDYWQKTQAEQWTLSDRLALERAQETLEAAELELDRLAKAREQSAEELTRQEAELKRVEAARDEAQRTASAATLASRVLEEKWSVWQQRNEDLQRDRQDLLTEHQTALDEIDTFSEAYDEAHVSWEEAQLAWQDAQTQAERATSTLRLMESQLNDKRRELAALRATIEGYRRTETESQETLTHMEEDCAREKARQAALRAEHTELSQAVSHETLSTALETFKLAEERYQKANRELEEKRASQQGFLEDLRAHQAELIPQTEAISQMRVEEENKAGLREQFSERLTELNADRVALAMQLEEKPSLGHGVRNRVMKLMAEIEALGPINHVAKAHLEEIEKMVAITREQIDDLEAAIKTLEEAIRKIDHETRSTMHDTFERVKAHFSQTFRHLFSGGDATIELVGDDILNAGVEVRAQPPGKKNSSLRLLSGGEQALTATALVFALFKLNPAPFCLLDEVDAPLDEANQGRLANMCRQQSHETQFLMITHHRVTMEYAQALIGVTMREPGVSRVVSVDIDEAAKMAE